jgi:transcriptional regulator with XRE-family HTH domain
MPFAENLRSELDYQDLIVKQLAARAGVNIHTLNHYLSGKKSMPPADVAVRIAAALGVSVEYLVTGRNPERTAGEQGPARRTGRDDGKEREERIEPRFQEALDNLRLLPENLRNSIIGMIDTAVRENKKGRA